MAVLQVVPQAREDEISIKQLAHQFSKEDVQLYYQIALHGRRDLSLSPDPRSGFEMIFLRLLTFRPLQEIAPPLASSSSEKKMEISPITETLEKEKSSRTKPEKERSHNPPASSHSTLIENNKNITEPQPENIETPLVINDPPPWVTSEPSVVNKTNTTPNSSSEANTVNAQTTDKKKAKKTDLPPLAWHQIVPQLNLTGRAAELLKHCILNNIKDNHISLSLDKYGEDLLAKTTQLQIETALSEYYNKPMNLLIDTQHLTAETPAERTGRKNQEHQQRVEDLIKNDPFVTALHNKFEAHLVPNSIKPK
jgi:DNA polymerase-3 subunit gamma/tau